jgi:zeaxanthin glucosyltransferase
LAHLGFLTLDFMGHLYPMSSLALYLKRRGHQVTFFCLADSETFLTRVGLTCIVFGRQALPPGYSKAVSDELGKLHGLRGLRYTLARFAGEMDAQLSELPAAIREAGIEALVIDQFFTSGSTIAEHLHLPYVHAANALMGNVDEELPPISFGWANDTHLVALMRNKAAHLFLRTIARPIRTKLNAQREVWGLAPYTEFLNERFGDRPQICQQPPGFEFPRRALPRNFHFVGPLHNRENRAATPFPWETIDGRPLIYASMGTLQNGLGWVFRRIAEACDGLNAQLVISLGGNMDPLQFSDLPGDPIVVRFAPQLELLQRAVLSITHAGLNTALESLAQGVPMVAIPVTNDQPAVAARIAWTGTGRVVPLDRLGDGALRASVIAVMSTPSYRENARRLQNEIDGLNSLERASEIVESVLK